MDNGSIMQRLREATWPQHQHAETRELERSLASGTVARELYVEYLGQRFLIHRALEGAIRRLREQDDRVAGIVLEELLQEGNLRRDLEFFGVTAEAVPSAASTERLVAEIESVGTSRPIALLGHYYVFEGSKNGSRIIAAAIARAYGLQPGIGVLYLDPHGARQRGMWLQFKNAMDAAEFQESEQAAIVAAAQVTFTLVSEMDDELYERSTSKAAGLV